MVAVVRESFSVFVRFAFTKIGGNSGNTGLVQSSGWRETSFRHMKKLLVFAAVLGIAAAMSAKGDEPKDNWTNLCAKCHGADGKGQTKMGERLKVRDYTDAKVQASFKDEEAFKAIKEGLKSDDGKTQMKAYDTLSDDQIKALVAYLRTFKH
jgi:cytochrome c553